MRFKILSSRNNNSPSLPPPAQGLQTLHIRGVPLLQCSCKCSPSFTLPLQGLQTKRLSPVKGNISVSGETRFQLFISSAENKASFKLHRLTPLLPSSGEKQTNKNVLPQQMPRNNMTVGFTCGLLSSPARLQQRKDKLQARK